MTRQKRVILDIIRNSDRHLDAGGIYDEAKKVIPNIAVGTVYRNLNILAENGEIRKIDIVGKPARFDKTLRDHEHLYCVKCGELTDIDTDDIRRHIEEHCGISIVEFNLSMGHVCKNCREKERNA